MKLPSSGCAANTPKLAPTRYSPLYYNKIVFINSYYRYTVLSKETYLFLEDMSYGKNYPKLLRLDITSTNIKYV